MGSRVHSRQCSATGGGGDPAIAALWDDAVYSVGDGVRATSAFHTLRNMRTEVSLGAVNACFNKRIHFHMYTSMSLWDVGLVGS